MNVTADDFPDRDTVTAIARKVGLIAATTATGQVSTASPTAAQRATVVDWILRLEEVKRTDALMVSNANVIAMLGQVIALGNGVDRPV